MQAIHWTINEFPLCWLTSHRTPHCKKTVTFKEQDEELFYHTPPPVDKLDVDELADTRPKVVTPKMKDNFVGLPSTLLKDEQDKLDEEGLFFDIINNHIYLGKAKVHNNKNFTAAAYIQKL